MLAEAQSWRNMLSTLLLRPASKFGNTDLSRKQNLHVLLCEASFASETNVAHGNIKFMKHFWKH
jgi:hypothetical protein